MYLLVIAWRWSGGRGGGRAARPRPRLTRPHAGQPESPTPGSLGFSSLSTADAFMYSPIYYCVSPGCGARPRPRTRCCGPPAPPPPRREASAERWPRAARPREASTAARSPAPAAPAALRRPHARGARGSSPAQGRPRRVRRRGGGRGGEERKRGSKKGTRRGRGRGERSGEGRAAHPAAHHQHAILGKLTQIK